MKQRKARGLVRAIDLEEYRFECPSDSFAAHPYLVDLEAHSGRGECACRDWVCNRHKHMREGETDPLLITCKHTKRCLVFWLKREIESVYNKKCEPGKFVSMRDTLFNHWIQTSASESDLIKLAFREIRRRVREKRKQNKGKRELES